jgi:hypothetical protein
MSCVSCTRKVVFAAHMAIPAAPPAHTTADKESSPVTLPSASLGVKERQKTLAPGEKPKYSGGMDVVRQLYKEGGVRSVFRGDTGSTTSTHNGR